jgi:hypothetical protein
MAVRQRVSVAMAAAIALAGSGPMALAQGPAPAPTPKAAARSGVAAPAELVAEVRKILAERYVLPEKRPALDAVLAQGLASGRYRVADPAELAQRIDADLARVGQDVHLNFRFDPAGAQALATRRAPAPDQAA